MALTKDDLIHKVIQKALLDPKSQRKGKLPTSVDGLLYYIKAAGVRGIDKNDIIKHAKNMKGIKVKDGNLIVDVHESIDEKAESKAQQKAAGIALAAKRGDIPVSDLKGASKEMYKMSEKDLEDFASTKHDNLPNKVKKESVNEAAMNASKMVKIFKDRNDWGDFGDQVYVKGGNLVVVDTFYYGETKAREDLKKKWSPGGWEYDYFRKTYGVDIKVVDTFSEFKAEGRHKKITSDGIVGVILKISGGQDKPITENTMVNEAQDYWEITYDSNNIAGKKIKKGTKVKVKARNSEEAHKKAAKQLGVPNAWQILDTIGRIKRLNEESVNEASKKSVTSIANALAKVADEMKKHAGYYTKAKQKGDAKEMQAHIGHLKQLTAQKKALEAGLDSAVGSLEKDVELVANEHVLRAQIRNMVRESINEGNPTDHLRQLEDAEVDKLYKIEKDLDDPNFPKKVIKKGRGESVYLSVIVKGTKYIVHSDPYGNDIWYSTK